MSSFIILLLILFSCKPESPNPIDPTKYNFIPIDTVLLNLSHLLPETSGLSAHNRNLWSVNDSGNKAALYRFDPESGKVDREIKLEGVKNRDWESMTTDSNHIYIGDFGNNLGSRRDLVIYKIPTKVLDNHSTSIKETFIEKIYFKYPDQVHFPGNYDHNFDAEAMIAIQDSLYIFTKNWKNQRCKVYTLPKTRGYYDARYTGEFDSEGSITGADIHLPSGTVVLLGYNPGKEIRPFIWILSNFENGNVFAGTKTRYNLNINRQAEGICFDSDSTLLITAEKGEYKAASVFRVNLSLMQRRIRQSQVH